MDKDEQYVRGILKDMLYDDFFEILERDNKIEVKKCIEQNALEYVQPINEKFQTLKTYFEKYFSNKFGTQLYDIDLIFTGLQLEVQKDIWKYYKVINELEKSRM